MDKNKILNDFLPDKIFDAHAHLYDKAYMTPSSIMPESLSLDYYLSQMQEVFGNRKITVNAIPFPSRKILEKDKDYLSLADESLYKELDKNNNNVGELLVLPSESAEHIFNRIKASQICGFKPYHSLSTASVTTNLDIQDYLPESAFELANEYNKVITLHLVKDASLSDQKNLKYITEKAKKYPNAILILAHAARAFASWTGFESVEKLKNLDNVFFDLSAICEVPAMFEVIKKCGLERVVWGSDFPISNLTGKAISLADKFYWIYDFEHPEITKDIKMWKVLEENLMAVRQTALMLDLTHKQIEDLFYNNAKRLFDTKKII